MMPTEPHEGPRLCVAIVFVYEIESIADTFMFGAVSKIGDRVAALVVRDAQAFVPMIPPPLFVGKSSPLGSPHPAHRASFLERTTLSN
jgi:hypothetical protein